MPSEPWHDLPGWVLPITQHQATRQGWCTCPAKTDRPCSNPLRGSVQEFCRVRQAAYDSLCAPPSTCGTCLCSGFPKTTSQTNLKPRPRCFGKDQLFRLVLGGLQFHPFFQGHRDLRKASNSRWHPGIGQVPSWGFES